MSEQDKIYVGYTKTVTLYHKPHEFSNTERSTSTKLTAKPCLWSGREVAIESTLIAFFLSDVNDFALMQTSHIIMKSIPEQEAFYYQLLFHSKKKKLRNTFRDREIFKSLFHRSVVAFQAK